MNQKLYVDSPKVKVSVVVIDGEIQGQPTIKSPQRGETQTQTVQPETVCSGSAVCGHTEADEYPRIINIMPVFS